MIPLKDDNPTRRPAILTIGLIVACTLVFLFQQSKPDDLSFHGRQAFTCEYGLVAERTVSGGDPRTLDGCLLLNQEPSARWASSRANSSTPTGCI